MANARNASGKGGKNRGRRSNAAKIEQQVQLGAVGVPFVAEGTKIHGTPSDPAKHRSTSGAYAASSVIERGTARKIAVERTADQVHLCACGCGQQPSQASSTFMPGHDSKVRAMGKAVNEGKIKATALPPIARRYLEEGGMIEA